MDVWKARSQENCLLVVEFEASLTYRNSSRTARATGRNPVSEKERRGGGGGLGVCSAVGYLLSIDICKALASISKCKWGGGG